jgi:hypothetical protein
MSLREAALCGAVGVVMKNRRGLWVVSVSVSACGAREALKVKVARAEVGEERSTRSWHLWLELSVRLDCDHVNVSEQNSVTH